MSGLLDGITTALLGTNHSGDYLTDALKNYKDIKSPELEDLLLNLQQEQSAGTLSPQAEQGVNLGNTAMEGISSDPRLREQQMSALQSIAGLASGKPTQADTAGFELARQNAAGEMQAKNNQVLQDMQQRGEGGSGAELLAKLKNNQSGAQMLQKSQLEQAQAMQQARLAALQQQSSMASNVRNQDYSEAANLAKAKDAIAAYNAQNQQGLNTRNTNASNNAQAANLTNAQNISNQNTNTMNQQQQLNKNAHNTVFNNQLALANAKSGIQSNQANNANQQYQNNAGMIGGLLNAGIGAAGKAYTANNNQTPNTTVTSDENAKKNISKSGDMQEFLDKLTAKNYDYKDPSMGHGQQTGVMAQDLEKTPQGASMVEDTPQGKVVDYGKGLGTMMAALAHINERLNKMENT